MVGLSLSQEGEGPAHACEWKGQRSILGSSSGRVLGGQRGESPLGLRCWQAAAGPHQQVWAKRAKDWTVCKAASSVWPHGEGLPAAPEQNSPRFSWGRGCGEHFSGRPQEAADKMDCEGLMLRF